VNEPIEIMAAFIIGRGESPLNSITVAKEITENIIDVYERNFTNIPVSVNNNLPNIISSFSLEQNYPNPFNPSTVIKYSIPQNTEYSPRRMLPTTLKVYDILGREVATLVNKQLKSGNYEVNFDASNLTSGVYFYRLQSGNFNESKKMILLK